MHHPDMPPVEFRDNSPSAHGWRRYGFLVWAAIVPLAVALTPRQIDLLPWLEEALRVVPLLRSMLDDASSPGKVAAFALATLAAYPLLHKTLLASRYTRPKPRRPWMGESSPPPWPAYLLAIAIADVVVLIYLNADLPSADDGLSRRARALLAFVSPDSGVFALGAAAMSSVLQVTIAAHVLILGMVFAPARGRR
ncbi:hypothetical protein [Pseudoxanthomonas sp. PXM02]|uniref:hypothetical protein n=1 Tax=Pseudoxanthomonas sp. PXM02 TaxID=2769294 RepID=UPI001780ABCA|nr:hypothetical protein [Pseudoxanthomonas sp. PXM02]MBD9478851.1 hypothetical protein [Pseudoxanthomonas sp. PXM02]